MTLTDAQKQALARAHSSTMLLWTVELRHSTFPAPIRLVQFTEDVTHTLEASAPADASSAVLFAATAFRFREPDISTEPDNTVTMQVDGVPGTVQPLIITANATSEPVEATCRALAYDVAGKTVTAGLSIYHLQVRHIRTTKTSVALSMGHTNSANQPFPRSTYTPETNPGLE